MGKGANTNNPKHVYTDFRSKCILSELGDTSEFFPAANSGYNSVCC